MKHKFRAWHIPTKKMTEDFDFSIFGMTFTPVIYSKDKEEMFNVGYKDLVIMEYLPGSIQDINKKFYCEYDLLRHRGTKTVIKKIVFYDGQIGIEDLFSHNIYRIWHYQDYEIIGNAYENPELWIC